jgi:hypothetical protein
MKFIHAKNDIHLHGHIHPCKWIKITLNFKFQSQASHSCTSHFHVLFHILHLKKEMQPTTNNVMSFLSLKTFDFKHL